MTEKKLLVHADLDEMEAHLDDTVPYYVPKLINELRVLRIIVTEARLGIKLYDPKILGEEK